MEDHQQVEEVIMVANTTTAQNCQRNQIEIRHIYRQKVILKRKNIHTVLQKNSKRIDTIE